MAVLTKQQVKTTVFNRKAVKIVKMIDLYWKGKDK